MVIASRGHHASGQRRAGCGADDRHGGRRSSNWRIVTPRVGTYRGIEVVRCLRATDECAGGHLNDLDARSLSRTSGHLPSLQIDYIPGVAVYFDAALEQRDGRGGVRSRYVELG